MLFKKLWGKTKEIQSDQNISDKINRDVLQQINSLDLDPLTNEFVQLLKQYRSSIPVEKILKQLDGFVLDEQKLKTKITELDLSGKLEEDKNNALSGLIEEIDILANKIVIQSEELSGFHHSHLLTIQSKYYDFLVSDLQTKISTQLKSKPLFIPFDEKDLKTFFLKELIYAYSKIKKIGLNLE